MIVYLDDGIMAARDMTVAQQTSLHIQRDLALAGFVVNMVKVDPFPTECVAGFSHLT